MACSGFAAKEKIIFSIWHSFWQSPQFDNFWEQKKKISRQLRLFQDLTYLWSRPSDRQSVTTYLLPPQALVAVCSKYLSTSIASRIQAGDFFVSLLRFRALRRIPWPVPESTLETRESESRDSALFFVLSHWGHTQSHRKRKIWRPVECSLFLFFAQCLWDVVMFCSSRRKHPARYVSSVRTCVKQRNVFAASTKWCLLWDMHSLFLRRFTSQARLFALAYFRRKLCRDGSCMKDLRSCHLHCFIHEAKDVRVCFPLPVVQRNWKKKNLVRIWTETMLVFALHGIRILFHTKIVALFWVPWNEKEAWECFVAQFTMTCFDFKVVLLLKVLSFFPSRAFPEAAFAEPHFWRPDWKKADHKV